MITTATAREGCSGCVVFIAENYAEITVSFQLRSFPSQLCQPVKGFIPPGRCPTDWQFFQQGHGTYGGDRSYRKY